MKVSEIKEQVQRIETHISKPGSLTFIAEAKTGGYVFTDDPYRETLFGFDDEDHLRQMVDDICKRDPHEVVTEFSALKPLFD